jgi:hypothetical protein
VTNPSRNPGGSSPTGQAREECGGSRDLRRPHPRVQPQAPERQHPYLDRFELLPPVAVPSTPSPRRHDQQSPHRVSSKPRRGIKSRGDTEGCLPARRAPRSFSERGSHG